MQLALQGADYLLRNDELFSAKSAYSAKMENLQSALSGLDDADRVAMHEYMVGEGNAIKPELKATSRRAKTSD